MGSNSTQLPLVGAGEGYQNRAFSFHQIPPRTSRYSRAENRELQGSTNEPAMKTRPLQANVMPPPTQPHSLRGKHSNHHSVTVLLLNFSVHEE